MTQSYTNGRIPSTFDLDGYKPMSVVYQLRGTILRRLKAGEKVLPEIDGRAETKADVLRALLSGAIRTSFPRRERVKRDLPVR